MTTRDYDRLILRSPHVRSFLQAIFLNYTLLLIGYSLRDPDFQLVLRELRTLGKISWTFGPKHFKLTMWLRSLPWRKDMLSWVLT